jgi:4-hydroxysphinganine ceramide fatty acyl 2-hydroxylase
VSQSFRNFLLRNRPFLVFPAVLAVTLWAAGLGTSLSWARAAGLFAGGLFFWTLLEWVLHRAMHVKVKAQTVTRFQDEAHLVHHREPHDVEHSVVSLRGSVPLALLFFAGAWLAFREIPAALLVHAGILSGYLFYEFVHVAAHAKWRLPIINALTRYHNRHHFESWNRTFGVTSPLWDWVFGTLPNRRERALRAGSTPSRAGAGQK